MLRLAHDSELERELRPSATSVDTSLSTSTSARAAERSSANSTLTSRSTSVSHTSDGGRKCWAMPRGRVSQKSRRGIGKPGAVILVIAVLVIGAYLGESGVIGTLGRYLPRSSNSTAGVGSTTSTVAPIIPISIGSMYSAYASNQAIGDSKYTGKTLYVYGSSGSVTKDEGGNYVSIGPKGCSLLNLGGECILFKWQSNAAANEVPTNYMAYIAQCSVRGYEAPDSSGSIDGFAALHSVLVLDGCEIISTHVPPPLTCQTLENQVSVGNVQLSGPQAAGWAEGYVSRVNATATISNDSNETINLADVTDFLNGGSIPIGISIPSKGQETTHWLDTSSQFAIQNSDGVRLTFELTSQSRDVVQNTTTVLDCSIAVSASVRITSNVSIFTFGLYAADFGPSNTGTTFTCDQNQLGTNENGVGIVNDGSVGAGISRIVLEAGTSMATYTPSGACTVWPPSGAGGGRVTAHLPTQVYFPITVQVGQAYALFVYTSDGSHASYNWKFNSLIPVSTTTTLSATTTNTSANGGGISVTSAVLYGSNWAPQNIAKTFTCSLFGTAGSQYVTISNPTTIMVNVTQTNILVGGNQIPYTPSGTCTVGASSSMTLYFSHNMYFPTTIQAGQAYTLTVILSNGVTITFNGKFQ